MTFAELDQAKIIGVHGSKEVNAVLRSVGITDMYNHFNHLWVKYKTTPNADDYSCIWGQCTVEISDDSEVEAIYPVSPWT